MYMTWSNTLSPMPSCLYVPPCSSELPMSLSALLNIPSNCARALSAGSTPVCWFLRTNTQIASNFQLPQIKLWNFPSLGNFLKSAAPGAGLVLIKYSHIDNFSKIALQFPFQEELLASLPCQSSVASDFIMFASLIGVKYYVIILHGIFSN